MNVKGFWHDLFATIRTIPTRKKYIYSNKAQPVKDPIKALADELHPSPFPVKITEIRAVGKDSKLYRFEPISGNLPPFQSGQYASFSFEINGEKTTRAYSISSAPYFIYSEHPYFEIIVKKVTDGFVSPYLFENWKVNDTVTVSMPFGYFHYSSIRDSRNLVLIAGGSGITPFYSMIEETVHGDMDVNITLLYGCKNEEEILLRKELDAIHSEKIKIVYVLSSQEDYPGEKGFINADMIRKYSPEDASYFVCGSRNMLIFLKQEFEKMGIPNKRVHYDIFAHSQDLSSYHDYPLNHLNDVYKIRVHQGKEITEIDAKASESIATSLERNHLPINTKCRNGVCGFCLIHLLKGNVYVISENDERRECEKALSYLHACSSFPLSDIEIDIPIK